MLREEALVGREAWWASRESWRQAWCSKRKALGGRWLGRGGGAGIVRKEECMEGKVRRHGGQVARHGGKAWCARSNAWRGR
jgi:hypothetical protein